MSRLQLELQRLYLPAASGGLVDAAGRVRALMLELARPADWPALSRVWQGVQLDLGLPAPAIAVSGVDGCQLWLSLAEPVPAAQAAAFLAALQARYLGDIKPERVTLLPGVDGTTAGLVRHASALPPALLASGLWSAFVAPDLAPMFSDEPWLDMPPNNGGQADLLAPLVSCHPADFAQALRRLQPAAEPAAAQPEAGAVDAARPSPRLQAPSGGWQDPQRFLLDVMNNDAVALALRIEAAKALLPHVKALPPP